MTSQQGTEVAPRLLPRGVLVLLGSAGAVVTITGIQAFADVLGPAFLALVLTVSAHPLLDRLQRRGWPTWLAVAVTTLQVIGTVLGLALALVLAVARLATLVPDYAGRFSEVLDQVSSVLTGWGIGDEQVRTVLDRIDFTSLAGVFVGLLSGLAGALSSVLFLLFLVFFMGVDAAGFPRRLRAVASTRPAVVFALTSFASGTRRYLRVGTRFGLIVAAIDTVVLWLLGIPLPLLWGLLSFVTNYIPNIGFVIGLAPPALLALLEGGPRLMLAVIALYSVINFLIQSVVQPKYVGDAVDLSLPVTFLSLVFWTAVVGPLGAVLAIPLTLLTKALLVDIDPDTRWLGHLMTSHGAAEQETEEQDTAERADAAEDDQPAHPAGQGPPSATSEPLPPPSRPSGTPAGDAPGTEPDRRPTPHRSPGDHLGTAR